jgi:hypothetical protein
MKQLLATVLVAGLVSATAFGIYQLQQSNALSSRIFAAEQNVKDKDVRITTLDSQISSLAGREKSLESDVAYWKGQYDSQSTSYVDLTDKYNKLQQQNSQLVGENVSLKSSRTLLQKAIDSEQAKSQAAQTDLAASPKPPYTMVQGREIKWVFKDSKGNLYHWDLPIDEYRKVIEAPQPQDMLHLKKSDGTTIEVRDHTKFVDDWSFKDIIDQVYANSKGDEDFLYELWYITSQMTTYTVDIGEQPRWALETFTEAGGDCEDTAILIASMIRSSTHTKDWDVQMVFFDLDHPSKATGVNHVALYVKTKDFSTFVESTDKKDGLNFWQGKVDGWYFDV